MNHDLTVECLINRTWNPKTMSWDGETVKGTLIDFLTQSAEDDNSGKVISVGIIVLETGEFKSVPLDFITIFKPEQSATKI